MSKRDAASHRGRPYTSSRERQAHLFTAESSRGKHAICSAIEEQTNSTSATPQMRGGEAQAAPGCPRAVHQPARANLPTAAVCVCVCVCIMIFSIFHFFSIDFFSAQRDPSRRSSMAERTSEQVVRFARNKRRSAKHAPKTPRLSPP